MQGDWETLCFKFCLCFFPISKVVSLQKEVLNFRQLEKESLGTSWDRFNDLIITSLDLAILDPMLLQYFYMGLSKDSSEARSMLDKISRKTPCTSNHNKLLKEEKESSPEQEEEVLIAKSQPL